MNVTFLLFCGCIVNGSDRNGGGADNGFRANVVNRDFILLGNSVSSGRNSSGRIELWVFGLVVVFNATYTYLVGRLVGIHF